MQNRPLFILAGIGVLAGVVSAYIYGQEHPAQPPVFSPAANPYSKGIYAEGIVESYQEFGENINLYTEVAGTVTHIFVMEGQAVKAGVPLLSVEDSVQAATVDQQRAQADAALAMLQELKAQPRPENLAVSQAQVDVTNANLRTASDTLAKLEQSYQLDSQSVSKDTLDTARNNVEAARRNLALSQRQYELTKAGAWSFDVRNQEKQYEALSKSYTASKALLDKYTLRAPQDGMIVSIGAAVGSYITPAQGIYDSYTQGSAPVIVMGHSQDELQVRCYIDEILVHRLPEGARIKAQLSVRGTDTKIPLEFVRIQPYVSPKIELSDQRTERVDVRVLPVIFKFSKPKAVKIFPGQLVDVYVGESDTGTGS